MKSSTIILVIVGIVFFTAIIYFANTKVAEKKNDAITPTPIVSPTGIEQMRTTIRGKVICLSHRDTSGPQTMECAYGLKADDGRNYAINSNLLSQGIPTYNVGDTISANGTVTPVEELSADIWQKYDIYGIFSITDSLVVEK